MQTANETTLNQVTETAKSELGKTIHMIMLRKQEDIPLEEIITNSQLSTARVNKIRYGRADNVTIEELAQLAAALRCKITDFFVLTTRPKR